MNVNGIWKVEMLGPYGWEGVSTAFFEDGKFRSASQDHFSIGSYSVDGDKVSITAKSHAHGKVRTLFGEKNQNMDLRFEGQVEGGQITGQTSKANSKFQVSFRATRVADLD